MRCSAVTYHQRLAVKRFFGFWKFCSKIALKSGSLAAVCPWAISKSDSISKKVLAGDSVQIIRRAKRANADRLGRWINGRNMLPVTVVHEIGHIIERRSSELLAKSVRFLEGRAQGESAVWLGPGHDRVEMAFRDEWVRKGGTNYTGKVYRKFGTEILSMGLQRLFGDPAGFYLSDREYFAFVQDVLRGL